MPPKAETRALQDILNTLPELIEQQAYGAAQLSLAHGIKIAKRLADFEALLHATQTLPPTVLTAAEDDAWAALMARLLCFARRPEPLLALTETTLQRFPISPMLVYRAWALRQQERFQESLELCERGLHLGFETDLAQRLRAEAMAGLGQAGWREAFMQARQNLQGRALGLCLLEEGAWLANGGDETGALHCFSAAVLRFDNDAYYRAWTHHNLGVLCLRTLQPETEDFFLQLQHDSTHQDAKSFQARALCGLGAVRRAFGEWERAKSMYKKACDTAHEASDQRQAWRGLGLTLRLSGQPRQAFVPLYRAMQIEPKKQWLHAEMATLHAQLGEWNECQNHLAQTGELNGEDHDRAQIAQAALHHHNGNHTQAKALLQTLPKNRLWMREEHTVFPELFALLEPNARPASLPRPTQTRVEIQACGVLKVLVNDRPVLLKPTGKPALLLVLLLEADDHAQSIFYLLDKLYGRDERKNQAALSALVRTLRTTLGWQDSIQTLGKAYRLHNDTQWIYDVATKRAHNQTLERFLEGADAPWIDDIRRHSQILN